MTIALLCAVAQGANADTWDGQTYEQPRACLHSDLPSMRTWIMGS